MGCDPFVVAVAQLNPTVGDIAGNVNKVRSVRSRHECKKASIVVFPELFISGYPPVDLALNRSFQDQCREAVRSLARDTADQGPAILVGSPWREGDNLYNSYCLLDAGEVQAVRHKVILPDYGPFGEPRLFDPGPLPAPVLFRESISLGLPICEDIWHEKVVQMLGTCGVDIYIVPNASPFSMGKWTSRHRNAACRVSEATRPLVYVNQVGGQDELIFDGASFALHADGRCAFQMPPFVEQVDLVEWHHDPGGFRCVNGRIESLPGKWEGLYSACVLALRDYARKSGLSKLLLGLSGGIDSALCTAMAVDAVGAENVHCVMIPYIFTSDISLADAAACAEALSVRYDCVSLAEPVRALRSVLQPLLQKSLHGTVEENIQSRLRGVILMAISNASGAMLVTTGNKSEMAMGYATLYGDMNGGYNPIKDVYKTDVIALAKWRNAHCPSIAPKAKRSVIPESIIHKSPSAELRENQRDADDLPPYPVLDSILRGFLEESLLFADLVERGHDIQTVARVEHALNSTEYKRRQSAPGARVSNCHLGLDRRYPIVNAFREGRRV